ncbi:formimidoylglutamate deiminase [Enterovirga sp.]|uniref:formimidoylglutamate deiminase n=1 Tax=Enterovirga sp. TaxID=2026350 RepID=UPI002622498B|nr:formimidoylglutamate deiminase [Enterovirga sp.]MDB5590383.1 N-formimino-L-glutamate deiminase [Enterovirga sp.]
MRPTAVHLSHALLPGGFAQDVRLELDGPLIASVSAGVARRAGDLALSGIAVPGLPNLHSHAFQRGLAGLAERRSPGADSFWTWREVMYRFLAALTPEDVEAIAALAYVEMLERGFTAVGEFHYLHHGPDGAPYDDAAELAGRVVAAAELSGIGLTLLPSLYGRGGFGQPASPGQRRFLCGSDAFAGLLERCHTHVRRLPGACMGVAPHSLRAVAAEDLGRAVALVPDGPIHIHVAEQEREVEECLAATGRRPVELLFDLGAVDARWCLIHATHMSAAEEGQLARSGAVAGLCPVTEASLGDGVFPGPSYLAAGGRFGVGSDSNIDIDAAGELRQLEYGQRLARRGRNLMTTEPGESTGARLLSEALRGGAQALAQPVGAVAPGRRCDLVLLDPDHPALAGAGPEGWLDAWIFAAGREAVRTVVAAGRVVVEEGRHVARDPVRRRYRDAIRRLTNL